MIKNAEERVKELEAELFTYKDSYKNIVVRAKEDQEKLRRRDRDCRGFESSLHRLTNENALLSQEIARLKNTIDQSAAGEVLLRKEVSKLRSRLKQQTTIEPDRKQPIKSRKTARTISFVEVVYL